MGRGESGSEPKSKRKKGAFWLVLAGSCSATLLLELIGEREAREGIKEIFAFYGLFGFISCAVLIFVAKVMGIVLKVKESYYD